MKTLTRKKECRKSINMLITKRPQYVPHFKRNALRNLGNRKPMRGLGNSYTGGWKTFTISVFGREGRSDVLMC